VLVGVEGLSIGDLAVHRALLGNGVIILEGLSLCGVPSGNYILHAPPLKLEGADGAPCRAILICQ
jgi:arylformamidase